MKKNKRMILNMTPISFCQQGSASSQNFFEKNRHTKEEQSLLDISWRESIPDSTQEYMNYFIKESQLPKLSNKDTRKLRSSTKNFCRLNKINLVKVAAPKIMPKVSIKNIIVGLVTPEGRNKSKGYKFRNISPNECRTFNIVRKVEKQKIKINQSCNILLEGSRIIPRPEAV